MSLGIVASGLMKSFGAVPAVRGLDLVVPQGTVMGLLGPNGAGKTTTVRMLATLVTPDAGECTVAGVDVIRRPADVRRMIGLSGQYAAVDEQLTGYENLEMVGRLYRLGRRRAGARATELLETFELTGAAHRPAKTYSGGMRRRLDLAAALVATPPVVFLDEPTTGLDPSSRLAMWAQVRELAAGGTTVLLTTQYLEEADQLASTICVIADGRKIAEGTPDELKDAVGDDWLHVTFAGPAEAQTFAAGLPRDRTDDLVVDLANHRVMLPVADGVAGLTEAVRQLDTAGIRPVDIRLQRPTLDDVFLRLTGAPPGDERPAPEAAAALIGGTR